MGGLMGMAAESTVAVAVAVTICAVAAAVTSHRSSCVRDQTSVFVSFLAPRAIHSGRLLRLLRLLHQRRPSPFLLSSPLPCSHFASSPHVATAPFVGILFYPVFLFIFISNTLE